MTEQMPRASDYPTCTPDEVNREYGATGNATGADVRQNIAPYGTAAWTKGRQGALRDVERNTSGRASTEPKLPYGTTAPRKADPPEVANDLAPLTPYANQKAPKGQGTITHV